MNIIICGVIGHLPISSKLQTQGHSVTVIDQSSEDIKKINDTQDVEEHCRKSHTTLCA